jgi:hypothetical protein
MESSLFMKRKAPAKRHASRPPPAKAADEGDSPPAPLRAYPRLLCLVALAYAVWLAYLAYVALA